MKLYNILENQLKKENNFVSDDGELKKWVVLAKAQSFDERLIELLLENEELKEKFFVKVKEALVFNQNLFIQFLEQKNYLNDSYTQYKNKVGLTIDGKYLKQRNEVALVWPFKDCILEGGQSKEEDKKEEIFFNEILAQDEITQLLEPKVLTNAKTYDKDGEHDFNGFTRDAELNQKRGLPENTITDNLIIKGNNLLALHSLKKEFAGKVKLIYIDPPYNTGNDGFKYNDSFNHSSWLTFMKSRLEIAKNLLRDDGVIFVQCDDNEQAYLKVLMDEVFGRENFISCLVWQKKKGGSQDSQDFSKEHEYILCYQRKKWQIYDEIQKHDEKDFSKIINGKKAKILKLEKWGNHSLRIDRPTLYYSIKDPNGIDFYPIAPNGEDGCWRKKPENLDKEHIFWKENSRNRLTPYEVVYFDEVDTKVVKTRTIFTEYGTTTEATKEIQAIFNNKIFATPKPENLIKKIVELSTQPNDIVLDFHLGSGTTAAVAHKMGRQYIGIEQMDYIETVAVERLKKVIEGEQGGISKSVDWQGGGSFTYLELKKYNQTFMEQIEEARDSETLLNIWEQMKEKSFLNYNVDLKKQDAHIDEFKQLELAQQKEHLAQLLDKNQLYVNLSSMDDTDFECNDKEKQVSKDFYQLKKD